MRKLRRIFLTLIVFSTLTAFTTIARSVMAQEKIKIEPSGLIEVQGPEPEAVEKKLKDYDLESYLNDIGHRESRNRYGVVNRFGYMGKYQFGRKTLDHLGFKKISNEEFLSSPEIQEEAMLELLRHNRHVMRRTTKKYANTIVRGILVTESGILAGAHLAGPRAVKRFLRGGKNKKDGLGTPVSSYIKKFSGYDLDNLK